MQQLISLSHSWINLLHSSFSTIFLWLLFNIEAAQFSSLFDGINSVCLIALQPYSLQSFLLLLYLHTSASLFFFFVLYIFHRRNVKSMNEKTKETQWRCNMWGVQLLVQSKNNVKINQCHLTGYCNVQFLIKHSFDSVTL